MLKQSQEAEFVRQSSKASECKLEVVQPTRYRREA
jgi:hypothetical protein